MPRCRACNDLIAFKRTPAGRPCPYDVDAEGRVTEVSHFTTCSEPGRFTKKGLPPDAREVEETPPPGNPLDRPGRRGHCGGAGGGR